MGRAGEFMVLVRPEKKIATGADLIASGISPPNRKQACVQANQKNGASCFKSKTTVDSFQFSGSSNNCKRIINKGNVFSWYFAVEFY